MTYRVMQLSDISLIIPMYIDYYNKRSEGEWTEQKVYKRIHQVWSMDDSYCLVVENDESIIAFAMGFYKQYDDLLAYDLEEILVDNRYQNMGIGTNFMNELVLRAKEKGASLIQLTSIKDELHEHFYTELGFYTAKNLILKVKII